MALWRTDCRPAADGRGKQRPYERGRHRLGPARHGHLLGRAVTRWRAAHGGGRFAFGAAVGGVAALLQEQLEPELVALRG